MAFNSIFPGEQMITILDKARENIDSMSKDVTSVFISSKLTVIRSFIAGLFE